MTNEFITMILDSARNTAHDRNEFLETLKKNLEGMYDDFVDEAKNKQKQSVYNLIGTYNYLPTTTFLKTYVCGVIEDKYDLFQSVDWNAQEVLSEITENATNYFVDKFGLDEDDKAVFYQWLDCAGDYTNEYTIIENLVFLHGDRSHPDLYRMYKECFGEDFKVEGENDGSTEEITNTELVKEKYVESYLMATHLCATIASSLALTYAVINTNNYCGDMGVNVVSCSTPLALKELGFSDSECETIAKLKIGESCMSEDYGNGVVVVRMA